MIIFGWVIASLGTVGLCSSVLLEMKKHEPIYYQLMKVSSGIMGIGGIILAISSL